MTPLAPANHPPHCQGCDGTGWTDGPPVHGKANGDPVTYTTVIPCTHIWWDDNPDP